MSLSIILMVVLGIPLDIQSKPESLLDIPQATMNAIETLSQLFSIGDRVCKRGLQGPYYKDETGMAVYHLDKKFSRVQAWIGIPDSVTEVKDGSFKIRVDGRSIKSGQVAYGDAPVFIDIDVTGISSIRIELSSQVTCGDPAVYRGSRKPPVSAIVRAKLITLRSPIDGYRTNGRALTLEWEPLSGAVNYGVEVVCVRLDQPLNNRVPRLYAINVDSSRTSYRFDISSLPPGQYRWAVIAFGDRGVLSKFSADRAFTVAR